MQCVILAGGIGTRMWPETRTVPKTLLPVHGKPFAAWQLSWLANSGIRSVVYSIGYLGDDVRAYVGDGSAWGVSVVYVDEGEHLRGTAGALRLALDSGVLEGDFLVLYGDSWLQVDPGEVLHSLRGRVEPALMTVHRNEGPVLDRLRPDRAASERARGAGAIRYGVRVGPVGARS